MTTDNDQTLRATGGCLCGAVRYEVRGALRPVVACHCSQCLRSHGHYAAYSATAEADVTVIEEGDLAWHQSSDMARRGFCRVCGSRLFWDPQDMDYIAISAGSIDQPSGLKLARHIFTADKPDYYEIADGLETLPTGMSTDQRRVEPS